MAASQAPAALPDPLDRESRASEYRDFVIVYRKEDPPVPPHWFRPVKDRPAEEKGKDPLCKMKSLDDKRHYEIISSPGKPSEDAKFLVDDDLVQE